MDRNIVTAIRRLNGFTLLEALVALVVVSMVCGLAWSLWTTSAGQEDRLVRSFSARQDLDLAMDRLAAELREGREVFYPAADGKVYSGLGFITAQGGPVAYIVEPAVGKKESARLVRVDLATKKHKTVAENVNYFKSVVDQASPGKKASLVTINLSVLKYSKDVEGKNDEFNIIRKVFIRNLKMDTPD